jgi:hypothetical protein
MNPTPAEGAKAAVSPGMDQYIADVISAGWAWSVFGPMSSAGPLAWGIEDCEAAAVERAEQAMTRMRDAVFAGIAGGGTERVCRRTISGGFRWWRV